MYVYSELFVIKNGCIATYHYDLRRNLELRMRDGEEYQPLSEEFWSWWAETVNYVPEVYQVDFAIVSDVEPSGLVIPENYQRCMPTCWILPTLVSCCKKLFEHKNVEFYEGENQIEALHGGIARKPQRFYFTRFNVPEEDEAKKEQRKRSEGTNDFIEYLRHGELPDIILKDIIR